MSRAMLGTLLVTIACITASAENYLLNGGQESTNEYQLIQKIEPTPETVTVNLSFVEPINFSSPTYQQEISNFAINAGLAPMEILKTQDEHGNTIHKYSWEKPPRAFEISLTFTAKAKAMSHSH